MSDLIKKLRAPAGAGMTGESALAMADAADEIERLTALRDAAEANATHWHTQCMQAREMAAAWEREARNLKEARRDG